MLNIMIRNLILPPYHQALFCEEQNHPSLDPLIHGYMSGYREVGVR